VIRYLRWQALITLLGITLLFLLLAYLAFNLATVVVPETGGTYVEGIAGQPGIVNPVLAQNDVDADIVSLVFRGLTRSTSNGVVVPDLARSWRISEDDLTYTFVIRDDALWHDGVPVTADDVVYTIGVIQDAHYQGNPQLSSLWRSVTVEKVDARTVRFKIAEPFSPFLGYTTLGLLPAHLLQNVSASNLPQSTFNLHPVGTGPFAIESLDAQKAILKAFPDFYGKKPFLAKVEFKFYPNNNAVIEAYGKEEVMGIGRVTPENMRAVMRFSDINLFSAPISGYSIVLLNLERPPFQDKKVRQALLYGLDRQRLIDQVLDGQGLVADSPILPTQWSYHTGIKKYALEPARARALLDSAGWVDEDGDGIREKDGIALQFALLTDQSPQHVALMEEIVRQWAEIGVHALPQTAGFSGLARDFLRPREFDAVLVEWSDLPVDPDPYPLWHSSQTIDTGRNYAGFKNRDADKLMEEGRRVLDFQTRINLYRQFQDIFAEELPSLPLYYPVYDYAVDRSVHNVQIGPLQVPSDRFRSLPQWYINTRRVILSETRSPS